MGLDLRLAFTIIAKPCSFEHCREPDLARAMIQIVDQPYMPKWRDREAVIGQESFFSQAVLDRMQYFAAWLNVDKLCRHFDGRGRHIFKLKRDHIHCPGK